MGTPEFALPTMEAILKAGHEIVAVVTQQDKKKGRGHKLLPPPVKEWALSRGLFVYQPETLKDEAFLPALREINPDCIVVVAYGKLLPVYLLDYPKYHCINVHASLLPKYRGAAPIERCVMNGETKTGITTMRMEQGLDTGDMILQQEVEIDPQETAATLRERLSHVGAQLLVETLSELEAGTAKFLKQDDSQASYAPMLQKTTGLLDFHQSPRELMNLIRGVAAYTFYEGKKCKVFCAREEIHQRDNTSPGEILSVSPKGILVAAGGGGLLITELQMEGGKCMPVSAYILGHEVKPGTILGTKALDQ